MKFSLILLILSSLSVISQLEFTNNYEDIKLIDSSFTLMNKTILHEGAYIGDNSKEKRLIIFVQGSGRSPLFVKVRDSSHFMLPKEILDTNNNYILLSKTGIPLVCDLEELDEHYNFVNKDSVFSSLFLETNYLEYYTSLYSNLVDNIKGRFNYSQLIIIGHSQGARIAAEFCQTEKVDKVVYMSADPLGRMAGIIDDVYVNIADREKEKDRLDFYYSIFDKNQQDSLYREESFKTWVSYSKPTIVSLSTSKVPVLIVYGDEDKGCPNCYAFSFLPSYYKNVTVNRYEGYDHNYYEDKVNHNWQRVMTDIYKWIEESD